MSIIKFINKYFSLVHNTNKSRVFFRILLIETSDIKKKNKRIEETIQMLCLALTRYNHQNYKIKFEEKSEYIKNTFRKNSSQ